MESVRKRGSFRGVSEWHQKVPKNARPQMAFAMVSYGISNVGKEFIAIITVEIRSGDVLSVETVNSIRSISGRIKKEVM